MTVITFAHCMLFLSSQQNTLIYRDKIYDTQFRPKTSVQLLYMQSYLLSLNYKLGLVKTYKRNCYMSSQDQHVTIIHKVIYYSNVFICVHICVAIQHGKRVSDEGIGGGDGLTCAGTQTLLLRRNKCSLPLSERSKSLVLLIVSAFCFALYLTSLQIFEISKFLGMT